MSVASPVTEVPPVVAHVMAIIERASPDEQQQLFDRIMSALAEAPGRQLIDAIVRRHFPNLK